MAINSSTPKFIALEGIDGSGKSTQAKLLANALQAEGHKVWLTCEPTKGAIGTMLRSIFSGALPADHYTIAALFSADRLQHILNEDDGLLKKMKEGYTIISDRYYCSSYAYHSVHVPMDWVIACNAMAAQFLKPDVHLFIDLPAEQCMERIAQNRSTTELYETLDNLRAVREKYKEAFERIRHHEQITIIDGQGSEAEVAQRVSQSLKKLFA